MSRWIAVTTLFQFSFVRVPAIFVLKKYWNKNKNSGLSSDPPFFLEFEREIRHGRSFIEIARNMNEPRDKGWGWERQKIENSRGRFRGIAAVEEKLNVWTA